MTIRHSVLRQTSNSACKSKLNYPHLNFKVDEIINIGNYKDYDCYFFSEITWYLLEDKMIDRVFDIMEKNGFKRGDKINE